MSSSIVRLTIPLAVAISCSFTRLKIIHNNLLLSSQEGVWQAKLSDDTSISTLK